MFNILSGYSAIYTFFLIVYFTPYGLLDTTWIKSFNVLQECEYFHKFTLVVKAQPWAPERLFPGGKEMIFPVVAKMIFPGESEVVKFHFAHWKLRTQPSFAENLLEKYKVSKSRVQGPPFRRPWAQLQKQAPVGQQNNDKVISKQNITLVTLLTRHKDFLNKRVLNQRSVWEVVWQYKTIC